MHAIYGGVASLWFFAMAMVASADEISEVGFWARTVQIAIGMLPGVVFHLNVATAGLVHQYQTRIRIYYALSCIVTLICLVNPYLFETPRMYEWGYYVSYSTWGFLTLTLLAAVFIDVILLYRRASLSTNVGKAHAQKLRAFYHGNMIATVALVDFLPAFGVGVYPFGFAVMTALHVFTAFGAIRYRLIEITPEFAASQILQTVPDGVVVIDTQGLIRLIRNCLKDLRSGKFRGYYVSYSTWGFLTLTLLAAVFIDVILLYRRASLSTNVGKAHAQKLRAFYHGNMIATVALVDFLPAFGVGVYPFGFAVMTALHVFTAFGAIRYRLIEITPEFAASQILQTVPDGVVVIDTQGLIRLINPTAVAMIGYDGPNAINQMFAEVAPTPLVEVIDQSIPSLPREVNFETTKNRIYTVRLSANELRDQASELIGYVWLLHDVSQQRQVEAEKQKLEGWVRHSQKLGTLGIMAGGVAHDFNNILASILGTADLARTRVTNDTELTKDLDIIIRSAERASELTTQMLTYAGRASSSQQKPVDINALCREISELLHSAVSKKANFTMSLADELPLVMADKSQMTQVIVNLINNASESLGDKVGDIQLRTGLLQLEDSHDSLESKLHVVVEVIDTGCGMDDEIKDHMFDPFFTTKFAGRGLGLASVMGIVDSNGGRIRVDSELGKGARLTIALPIAEGPATHSNEIPEKRIWRAQGIALVVDDEPEVRRVTGRMLERMGFEVEEAAHGKEALAIFSDHQADISVVVLDLTMPIPDISTRK